MLCPLYAELLNQILQTGNIPRDWLTGIIVPIYKNTGDTHDVNSYFVELFRKVVLQQY